MRQAIQIDDEAARVTDAAAITAASKQCTFLLPGAIVEVWQRPGWLVVEQAYDLIDLYTSYLEVLIDAPQADIPIRCPENDLYWLYVLVGQPAFAHADGTRILTTTTKNHYRLQYLPNGRYRCRLANGLHQLFYTVHKPRALFREESPELDVHAQVVAALKAQAKIHAIGEALSMHDGSDEAIRKFLRAPGDTYLQRRLALQTLSLRLVFFARASVLAKSGQTKIAAEWAETMKAYIDKCIAAGEHVDMHTVAGKSGVSVGYVRTIFDSIVQKPIGQYITSRKLDYSRTLMETGLTPKQTATYLGWSHPYFCVTFKKEFKVTPSTYQKNKQG